MSRDASWPYFVDVLSVHGVESKDVITVGTP